MEWISGNIFIRPQGPMKKNDVVQGHKHNFDHTTIVFRGAIRVKAVTPGGSVIIREFGENLSNGRHFLVKAEVEHEITALVDGTEFWCVYSHRTPQGEISQIFEGWSNSYV